MVAHPIDSLALSVHATSLGDRGSPRPGGCGIRANIGHLRETVNHARRSNSGQQDGGTSQKPELPDGGSNRQEQERAIHGP